MSRFHRLAAVCALSLAVLVAVQALDVLPCADEMGQDAGHSDAPKTTPDCLCHVSFTRTEVVPTVADAMVVMAERLEAPSVRPPSVADEPVDHVPLA